MMTILSTIVEEALFRLNEESVPRIKKCFGELSDEEIWTRPNSVLSSPGNLVLHLIGNARQYILFGLAGHADNRKRQAEFDHNEIIPKDKLLNQLDSLMVEIKQALNKLGIDDLTKTYQVQGMKISGFGIIMHVVEHFSYHVGQITWQTKIVREKDLNYYAGHNLDITG